MCETDPCHTGCKQVETKEAAAAEVALVLGGGDAGGGVPLTHPPDHQLSVHGSVSSHNRRLLYILYWFPHTGLC